MSRLHVVTIVSAMAMVVVLVGGCRVTNVQPYHSIAGGERFSWDVVTHMRAESCDGEGDDVGLSVIAAKDTTNAGSTRSYVLISPMWIMQRDQNNIVDTYVHLGVPLDADDAAGLAKRLLQYEADWNIQVLQNQAVFGEWVSSIPVEIAYKADTLISMRSTVSVNYSKTANGTALKISVSDRQLPWEYSLSKVGQVACLRKRIESAIASVK